MSEIACRFSANFWRNLVCIDDKTDANAWKKIANVQTKCR